MKCLSVMAILILSLGLAATSYGIDADEMPFGTMFLNPNYSSSDLARLDSMCFNHLIEYRNILDEAKINALNDIGVQAVRGGIYNSPADAEPQVKYSWSNYAVIDVDYPYPNPEVRMEAPPQEFSNGVWNSPRDSRDTLRGISTWQPGDSVLNNGVRFYTNYFFPWFHPEEHGRIIYRCDIHMSIDSLAGDSPSDTVAHVVFKIGGLSDQLCEADTAREDIILASECGPAGIISPVSIDTLIPPGDFAFEWKKDTSYASPCDCIVYDAIGTNQWKHVLLFLDIATTGERQVAIDKIVISDQYGRDLMAGYHDVEINGSFDDYNAPGIREKIYGWHLFDEPPFCSFMPVAYIRGLMNQVYSAWTLPINVMPSSPKMRTPHSYLTMVDSTIFNPDLYPLGINDTYSGPYFQDREADGAYGPLKNFNMALSWNRSWVEEEGYPDAFWVTLQSHDDHLGNPPHPYQRFPTASELSCMTYMSMAWGVKGMQYWWYDQPTGYGDGIISHGGQTTRLYYEIKDHIAPYVHAVDEYYMPLDWERTYPYHATSPVYNPPAGAYVSSISSASIIGGLVTENDPNINPDRGWFHVGEFTKPGTSDKYFMLLNRACSQGMWDPAEAPSVTATVKFNPTNVGLGDYVYVIDLATGTDSADWAGTPQTTYTAKMADGTIPFTTTLRAGEGRLFKIAEANPPDRRRTSNKKRI